MFIKSFKLKTSIQNILCQLTEIIDFSLHHPIRKIRIDSVNETVAYINKNMLQAPSFYTAKQLLDYALQQIDKPCLALEFGVYYGGSINYIAKKLPESKIIGFDSFEGLPSSWTGNSGSQFFNTQGAIPKVKKNVELIKGWFNESIPKINYSNYPELRFIHIDCDLYDSTFDIFQYLGSNIKSGCIIVFDEYFGYPGWKNHEFKAFQEWVAAKNINYKYIGYSRIQVAIQIL